MKRQRDLLQLNTTFLHLAKRLSFALYNLCWKIKNPVVVKQPGPDLH